MLAQKGAGNEKWVQPDFVVFNLETVGHDFQSYLRLDPLVS